MDSHHIFIYIIIHVYDYNYVHVQYTYNTRVIATPDKYMYIQTEALQHISHTGMAGTRYTTAMATGFFPQDPRHATARGLRRSLLPLSTSRWA